MKLTVRDFRSISQMDNGETYFDLPVIFEGTTAECHAFCQAKEGYSWRKDSNIFGGYYKSPSARLHSSCEIEPLSSSSPKETSKFVQNSCE